MTFEELNNKVLSNGKTRRECVARLQSIYHAEEYVYHGYYKSYVDIPYDIQSVKQKYNVYTPKSAGKHPTIIYVHGGGWFEGNRADGGVGMVLPLVAHGYAVVTIGYRLVDEAVFPDMIYDVIRGMDAALERAEEFGLDPDNLCAIGGSAGTNMCLLPALWSKYKFKACVLRCALLDLSTIRKDYEESGLQRKAIFGYPDEDTSMEAMFLGGSLSEVPEQYEKANPANYIDKDCPYFLLLHGLIDRSAPYQQSVAFAKAVEEKAGKEKVILHLYEDTPHDGGFYNDPSVFEEIVEFLNKHMR